MNRVEKKNMPICGGNKGMGAKVDQSAACKSKSWTEQIQKSKTKKERERKRLKG